MNFLDSLNIHEYYGVIAILGLFLFIWLLILIWTTKDVFIRSKSFIFQVFSIVLVILFNVLGLILYLCIRPHRTLDDNIDSILEKELFLSSNKAFCDSCNCKLEKDFIFCPNCGETIKKTCLKCKKYLDTDFKFCPFCNKDQIKTSKKNKSKAKKGKK